MASDARATLEVSKEGRLFLELVEKCSDVELASALIAAGAKLYTANGKENIASQPTINLSAALVSMKALSFINPRGKFDLTFTTEALCISNAKSSIVVPNGVITHVAVLDQIPQDTKKRCLLFIVLDRHGPPVMSGKQRLDALIVQTLESDTVSVTASSGEALDGPLAAVLCQALGMCIPSFTNFIAPDPNVYRSAKGHNAVPAFVKVSSGLLFPLAGALLFAERPALFVPHADVLAVEFRRPQSATFDLVLHVRGRGAEGGGGGEGVRQVEFSQVDAGELGRLRNYFAAARIQPYDPANPPRAGGAGPSAGGGADAGSDSDAGGRDEEGDDDEDEDDEDFDPSELQRAEAGTRPAKRARAGEAGPGAGGSSSRASRTRGPADAGAGEGDADADMDDEEGDDEEGSGADDHDGHDDGSSEADSYDEEEELADLTDEEDLAAEAVRQRVRGGGTGGEGGGGAGSQRAAESYEDDYVDYEDDD